MGHGLEGLPELRFGKSTPKVPQLVIELQNRPLTAKPDTACPSTNEIVQFNLDPPVILTPILSEVVAELA